MKQLPASSRRHDRSKAPGPGRWTTGALLALGLMLGWSTALAGTSGGAASLLMQSGSGALIIQGDYVSSAAGLDTYYSYFIEVPPGTSSLQIDIFDLDIGGLNDRIVGGAPPPGVPFTTFRLLDPSGGGLPPAGIPPVVGMDNMWQNGFLVRPAPMPGHWELRIDTSSAVTTDDDVQAYGVRAHDGDAGSGGRELNVYVESFVGPGGVPAGQRGLFHPYITSGCDAQSNDFDWDGSTITYSSVDPDPTSGPAARFTTALPTSTPPPGGTWLNQSFGRNQPSGPWTTDESAHDYGIWSLDYTLAPGDNGVLYVGAFNAAASPPSAQPEPDTFRIYLPTDAGGPPVKPQMGQGVVNIVSGVDPPTGGSETVLRIAVTINNPTPYPITFSEASDPAPAEVVSVEVPFESGNRVNYMGNPSMTHGGIVSAPAVGTNGTIIWAPGRIEAFTFAQLEYDLSVVPSPAASQPRTNITGTPASGGTTATYVDETCSSTLSASPSPCSTALQLAGATHTLGPLCELAVTKGTSLATRAVVDELRAYGTRRGVMVEWTTLAEHGTVGFHLLRLNAQSGEYERVNDRLLPGLLHSRQGGTYRYRDALAAVGEMHTYKLVEVEANGNRLEYGPYSVIVAKNRKRAGGWSRSVADAPLANLERAPRARPAYQKARRKARKKARLKARLARRKRRAATAKITIQEPGLYYLDAARIGEVLGLRTARVRRLIRSRRLSLSNRGEPVATTAARGNRGLYFYGEGVGGGNETQAVQDRRDDIYTQENIYLLRRGRGLPMGVVDGGRPEPVAGRHFRDTVRAEGNKYTVTHLFDDPDGDYWMWDFRIGGLPLSDCDTVEPGMPCYIGEYPLPSPGVVDHGDADATLTVRLHGGTQTADAVDHRVSVSLNGRPLGNAEWDGTIAHTARFTFPANLLLEAGNSVAIDAAPSADPDMPSVVYVNDITLDYPRAFSARAQSLLMPAAGSHTETVDGFHSKTMRVFDLADPKRPARVVNTTIDGRPGNYRVSFVAGQQPRSYLVIDPSVARTPVSVFADEPSNLRSRRHRVDYLIITADEMLDAAEVLANHRRAQGLRAMVVDVENIYDEFNHGIQNAEAIWRFLRHAYLTWRQAPRYVLFAGEGSHDYKDYLGNGDAIIPTLLAPTPQGLFPSDNLYVDVVGNDRLPEMAAGRIPAMNAEELLAVSEKIIAYEHGASDEWTSRALLAADAADDGGDYPEDSEHLAGIFPQDYDVERIHLNSMDLASARSRIIDALNSGQAFMNFIGHGGSMALGNRGLLRVSDLESLANGGRLPVITAQTCLAGQFGFPGVDGIGELLLLRPDRGAVAVWSASGLSINDQAILLGDGFYRSAFESGERVIGDTILEAQRRYAADGGDEYLLDIYNLIGDPATIMK